MGSHAERTPRVSATPPVEHQRRAVADDIGGRLRSLLVRRQAARDEAIDYRQRGQLVPGSLGDEIIELGAELQWALGRYVATRPTSQLGESPEGEPHGPA